MTRLFRLQNGGFTLSTRDAFPSEAWLGPRKNESAGKENFLRKDSRCMCTNGVSGPEEGAAFGFPLINKDSNKT